MTEKENASNKEGGNQEVEKYVPGAEPASGKALENYHRLTFKQVKFLESYAKNLGDINKAAKAAGVAVRTVKESWLKEVGIQEEIARIQECWAVSTLKGTAEEAMTRHIGLMNKMEDHLDQAKIKVKDKDTGEEKEILDTDTAAKVMNPLAKMSDTYLKATGKFNDDNKQAGVTVNINITDSEIPKTIDIEGEAEEVKDD